MEQLYTAQNWNIFPVFPAGKRNSILQDKNSMDGAKNSMFHNFLHLIEKDKVGVRAKTIMVATCEVFMSGTYV